jgi:hypothetical protein
MIVKEGKTLSIKRLIERLISLTSLGSIARVAKTTPEVHALFLQ